LEHQHVAANVLSAG